MSDNIEVLAMAMRSASPAVIKSFLYRIQASAWDEGYNALVNVERDGHAVNPYELLVETEEQ